MIKKIPEQTILICDRCKKEGERQKEGPFRYGGTHLKGEDWGVFFGGDVGGCSVSYDFCSFCKLEFQKWIGGSDE